MAFDMYRLLICFATGLTHARIPGLYALSLACMYSLQELYQLKSQHGLSGQATQHPKQARQHPDQLTWHPDHCRCPAASEAAAASAPAASESSQQGKCCSPDGTFVGRAAALLLLPNIKHQTRAALGL